MRVEINPAPKVILVIGGVEYPCSKPKLGPQIALEEAISKAESEKKPTTRLIADHLVSCGLPAEVVMELAAEELTEISEALKPAKKK